MNGIVAAFGSTGLYYVGFAIFKLAADRMEVVRANRLGHLLWTVVSNWIFLIGLALVLGGLSLQILALAQLSLGIAVPIFMSGVFLLLLICLVFFGERLTGREWLSLLMIGAAMLLITASIGQPEPITAVNVPLWTLAVIGAPALLVPLLIQLFGDLRPDGKHARPITGIAYGLSSGVPIGTAELCIKGWSDTGISVDSLLTPYPYATVVSAVIGFGVMMGAFQRCRASIVAVVMTASAKTHLLVTGTFMYGEPWPHDAGHLLMRTAALALAVIAIVQFPRHRPLPKTPSDAEPSYEQAPPAPLDEGAGAGRRAGPAHQAPPAPLDEGDGAGRRVGPVHAAPTMPAFEDAPPGLSPFDRPQGQRPPGRRGPGRPAPDRASGPWSLDQDDPQAPREYPTPSPYAQDPLGRGPYRRHDPWADDPSEEDNPVHETTWPPAPEH